MMVLGGLLGTLWEVYRSSCMNAIGRILAAFTCSLSADAPCLLTGKAYINMILIPGCSLWFAVWA